MKARKHAEMIKAWADNDSLICFYISGRSQWQVSQIPHWKKESEYFLCLPQHKEACLHWLNGGLVLVDNDDYHKNNHTMEANRYGNGVFMIQSVSIKIKPRKEKRIIGINVSTGQTTSAYECDDEGNYAEDEIRLTKKGDISAWQFIEIEVEV